MKKRYYVLFFLIFFINLNLIFAAKVLYVYKSESKINDKIVDIFKGKNLKVDFVNEKNFSDSINFLDYNFVFIGNEIFKKDLLIGKYPAIIFNSYIGYKSGITDRDGINKLAAREPLSVIVNGKKIKVYNSAVDKKGIAIPYYFLDINNKAPSFKRYAGTFVTSSGDNFGDVIAFADSGVLLNGRNIENPLCFFGITESSYWTPATENLFLDCIDFVNKEIDSKCNYDSDCGKDGIIGNSYCVGNDVFRDFISYKCNNPGSTNSFCSSEIHPHFIRSCPVKCLDGECVESFCSENSECDDNNNETEDWCINSKCFNVPTGSVILISLLAIPKEDSVTLFFSFYPQENERIKGFKLKKENEQWIEVEGNIQNYTFSNLQPSTEYTFYVVAVDKFNRNSNELNIKIKTLEREESNIINPSSAGGSRGGTYCLTKWNCTEWSKCINGIQTRSCSYPPNFCKPYENKPIEIRNCEIENLAKEEKKVERSEEIKEDLNEKKELKNNNIENKSIPITGAFIGVDFIKNSWKWILVLLIMIILGYLGYKFILKKK